MKRPDGNTLLEKSSDFSTRRRMVWRLEFHEQCTYPRKENYAQEFQRFSMIPGLPLDSSTPTPPIKARNLHVFRYDHILLHT
jgi:hypothetical protein